MDKPNSNLCKQACTEGRKKFNLPCVTKGVPKDIQQAKEENLKFEKMKHEIKWKSVISQWKGGQISIWEKKKTK